ncbi:MAG: transporter substrate-binding domain-containing protein [Comamonas sp.]
MFMLLGAVLAAGSAQAADDLAAILGGQVVRVGAVSAPPWYQKDLRTNQWTGLVPDLAQALFQGTGVRIDYVDTQWGTAVAGLQSDRFDLLGGFNKTPERAQAVDFTRPIGAHKMGVLTLEADVARLQTWDRINQPDVTLSAVDGSAVATLLQPRLTRTRWVIVPNSEAMQLEVESGRATAMLTSDIQMAQYVARRGRGQIVFPTPVQEQATNIGLRKDRAALRGWLDARLDALERDGTLARIWARYVPTGQ